MATILRIFFRKFRIIWQLNFPFWQYLTICLSSDCIFYPSDLFFFDNLFLATRKQRFHRPKTAFHHEKKPGSLSWSCEVAWAKRLWTLQSASVKYSSAEQAEQVRLTKISSSAKLTNRNSTRFHLVKQIYAVYWGQLLYCMNLTRGNF